LSSEPALALHLVSCLSDQRAWDACRAQAAQGVAVEVVLIHDAVLETEASIALSVGGPEVSGLTVLACADDAKRRKVEERWALIGYAEMIDRCSSASTVTCW
jgi:hypothetical protein